MNTMNTMDTTPDSITNDLDAPAVYPLDLAPNQPEQSLLQSVKNHYPLDPATQQAIDQKFQRRLGNGWSPISLSDLTESLERLVAAKGGDHLRVTQPRWLTGGASKIQMAFTLVDERQGSERELLLRMDPPETLNATNKHTEFEIIQHVREHISAPECLWLDASAQWLPEPGMVSEFVVGVTKPTSGATSQVSGIGTNFGPGPRVQLGQQFIDTLAKIHTMDVQQWASPAVTIPQVGTQESAQWRLNFERQLWELDRLEDHPIMEIAANWLNRNIPTLDRASLVHGDYRSGNFLFQEPSLQVTSWLDWESAHIGDRHFDLAYTSQEPYGHFAEDGKTFLVAGLVPLDEFFSRYEEASGLEVDRERLHWYRILTNFSAVVKVMATSARVASLGRSHQDILLARLEGVAPTLLRILASDLEEVL